MPSIFAGRSALVGIVALLQAGPQIPAPRGLVNDFANVIPAATAARIEQVAQSVRDRTKGEIAVVTLSDLGGRDPSEISLRIGREWKVGNLAAIGDRSRNAGVVILVVPKETSADGKGHCRVETGQGVEGFITDAMSADMCREATPAFAQRDYGSGLELITSRVAERYAQEYNVSLDSTIAPARVPAQGATRSRGGRTGINPVFLLFALFFVLSLFGRGRRRGCLPLFLPFGGFGGGGGGFGGGGFGGGGFGGFGGGGGFSGGGGGSDW